MDFGVLSHAASGRVATQAMHTMKTCVAMQKGMVL